MKIKIGKHGRLYLNSEKLDGHRGGVGVIEASIYNGVREDDISYGGTLPDICAGLLVFCTCACALPTNRGHD